MRTVSDVNRDAGDAKRARARFTASRIFKLEQTVVLTFLPYLSGAQGYAACNRSAQGASTT
jgi:hypothetical protein